MGLAWQWELEQTLVLGLVVYRLAWMVAREEGPFSVFTWLRGRIDPHQRTWVGRGLNCAGCVSFWLALIATLLLRGSWLDWLAMAGLAAWLTRF